MGQLINGKWVKGSVSNNSKDGGFKRLNSIFRNYINEGHDTYLAESNRYHLYVSYACPWAHRTLIFRKLKNLEDHISVDFSHPDMLEMGWSFAKDFPKATGDTLYNKKYAHEIYQISDEKVSTKATVPILWDKKTRSIVNNGVAAPRGTMATALAIARDSTVADAMPPGIVNATVPASGTQISAQTSASIWPRNRTALPRRWPVTSTGKITEVSYPKLSKPNALNRLGMGQLMLLANILPSASISISGGKPASPGVRQ